MPIGPPPAKDSYLRVDAIIEAARSTGAEAIHPGYGFLSENADFAQACEAAGLVFVGPSAETIRLMGSKSAAKALMESAGVPVVPGYHGDDQSLATLQEAADRIGYPVLVKASAGGGGKGMRVVGKADELAEALAGAQREARRGVRRRPAAARKIPRQAAPYRGAGVRRRPWQRGVAVRARLLAAAPPPEGDRGGARDQPRRRSAAPRCGAAARAAAQAVNYVNAGTVEFIADAAGFYFMEMNTRLQVEHPVTEMITGLDLVEWQLRIAFGERLPLPQDKIAANGHAVEARIYAEDADKGFLPSIGRITRWREPPASDGIRVDTGFRAGDTITPYYDALLAKLIVWDTDRAQALDRMAQALNAFEIVGVTTNVEFLEALVGHSQVRSGEIDTDFIERELSTLAAARPLHRPGDGGSQRGRSRARAR